MNDFAHANHPPVARVRGELRRTVKAGEIVSLDASDSSDPDRQPLRFDWIWYPEPGSYRGPAVEIRDAASVRASFTAPPVDAEQTLHIVLAVTDPGEPPLTRYQRVVCTVKPR